MTLAMFLLPRVLESPRFPMPNKRPFQYPPSVIRRFDAMWRLYGLYDEFRASRVHFDGDSRRRVLDACCAAIMQRHGPPLGWVFWQQ